MHSGPIKRPRTDAYQRGYFDARRDAANLVAVAPTFVAAEQAIRSMKPRPGAKTPKERTNG